MTDWLHDFYAAIAWLAAMLATFFSLVLLLLMLFAMKGDIAPAWIWLVTAAADVYSLIITVCAHWDSQE